MDPALENELTVMYVERCSSRQVESSKDDVYSIYFWFQPACYCGNCPSIQKHL